MHGCPNIVRKELYCQKWKPYMARRPFFKPIHAKEERNGPPSADQVLSTAKPRSGHATHLGSVLKPAHIPLCCPFWCIVQNLSSKDIVSSDITS